MIDTRALLVIMVIILLVPIAFFVPALLSESTKEMQDKTVIINEGETHNLGQYLQVSLDRAGNDNTNVTITDMADGETISKQISENETVVYEFNNGDVTTTLTYINTDTRVVLDITSPKQFGWSESEKEASNFMPNIIVFPILIILIGLLYMVIKEDNNGN